MVNIYIGQKSRVLYKEEPSWNSWQDPTDWLGLVQRCNIGDVDELLTIRAIGAAGRNVAMHEPGRELTSGAIELFPQNGKLFKFGFGKVTTTGEAPGPYTHVIEEDDIVPSMSLASELYTTGSWVRRYSGVKVDTLTLAARQGEPLRLTLDIIGRFKDTGFDALSVTPDTTRPYTFAHGQIKKEGGIVEPVLGFEYTLANNLDPQHYLKQDAEARRIQDLPELSRDHHASIELNMWDSINPWHTDLLNANKFDIEALFKRADNDELKLELTDCVFEEFPVDIPVEGRVTATFPISARTAKITVIDSIETY